MTEVKVTQADLNAAQGYWGNDNPPLELQRAFAAHRIASQAELVEALKEWVAKLYCASGCSCCRDDAGWYAASARLGDLLGAPRYEDSPDTVDWYAVRDAALNCARREV